MSDIPSLHPSPTGSAIWYAFFSSSAKQNAFGCVTRTRWRGVSRPVPWHTEQSTSSTTSADKRTFLKPLPSHCVHEGKASSFAFCCSIRAKVFMSTPYSLKVVDSLTEVKNYFRKSCGQGSKRRKSPKIMRGAPGPSHLGTREGKHQRRHPARSKIMRGAPGPSHLGTREGKHQRRHPARSKIMRGAPGPSHLGTRGGKYQRRHPARSKIMRGAPGPSHLGTREGKHQRRHPARSKIMRGAPGPSHLGTREGKYQRRHPARSKIMRGAPGPSSAAAEGQGKARTPTNHSHRTTDPRASSISAVAVATGNGWESTDINSPPPTQPENGGTAPPSLARRNPLQSIP